MPWTFAHPVAILPFRRFAPQYVSIPAFVVGTLSPDFSFYGCPVDFSTGAHTVWGSFLICLPTSFFVLAAFYLLREPVSLLFPQPHRDGLLPLARVKPDFCFRSIVVASISVLIGAWTHIFWDGFTHECGWAAQQIPFLRASVAHFPGFDRPLFSILQHCSTLIGTTALVYSYLKWLRHTRTAQTQSTSLSEQRRHFLFVVLATVSIATAVIVALLQGGDHFVLRAFIVRISIHSVTVFMPLLIVFSLIHHRLEQRRLAQVTVEENV